MAKSTSTSKKTSGKIVAKKSSAITNKPKNKSAKKKTTASTAAKTTVSKKIVNSKPKEKPLSEAKSGSIGTLPKVTIRMYCIGTGDCFVLKFKTNSAEEFNVMIDCGSCIGGEKEFTPYVKDLANYVNNRIDLLVITHEHNDHVNGFVKCKKIFEGIEFKAAWFAWTEDPNDPDGTAEKLKQKTMKIALAKATEEIKNLDKNLSDSGIDALQTGLLKQSARCLLDGLETLGVINLSEDDDDNRGITGRPLPGMEAIKEILEKQKVKPRYLSPGESIVLPKVQNLKFYVLGPPTNSTYIYKDGKQGADIYKNNSKLNNSTLAANAFLTLNNTRELTDDDLPFASYYVSADTEDSHTKSLYNHRNNNWRNIDYDWLNTAGALALRLNSHINNTSLVLAIELQDTKEVILFPGDAEYGSWDSWHMIDKWKNKGEGGKPWAEDLLNRTIFYKVSHHLSYNGTALEKGVKMMNSSELAAMATLDRNRIAKKWTTTMPNFELLKELTHRTNGKLFIMDESQITNAPSKSMNPKNLGKNIYEEGLAKDGSVLYKQYSIYVAFQT